MTDWKKIGKKSKRKGSNYERKVARDLTKITGYNWRRVPYSGASYIPGDVTIVEGDIKLGYVVELKNRADLTLSRIFKHPAVLGEYLKEGDILIFNNEGQSIAVVPQTFFKKTLDMPIYLCYNGHVAFDLKYFWKVIKKG